MLKVAHYRRNAHPNSGFKEKFGYQLAKGPMTGRELCALFNMSLAEFNHNIRDCIRRQGETLQVEASAPVKVGRATDKTYTLVRKPRRVTPTKKKEMVVSWKQLACKGEEHKQQAIEAAKRRARLIKKGINPGLFD